MDMEALIESGKTIGSGLCLAVSFLFFCFLSIWVTTTFMDLSLFQGVIVVLAIGFPPCILVLWFFLYWASKNPVKR